MRIDDLPSLVAIVLTADQSLRMGRPKLDLPWAGSTVIAHVVQTLAQGVKDHGLNRIIVVLGDTHQQITQRYSPSPLISSFNCSSIQAMPLRT